MDNLQFLFFFITNKQKTMKKIFSLMVACAAMFAFAACEGGSDDTDKGNNGDGEKTALATPVLTVTDVTSTSFVVTWEAVENAVSYMVNDGEKNNTITETSFKMENLNAGKYTVKVMAMAGEGANYSNSEFATVSQDVTGASIDEVDWISHVASVPTDEDAQYGYYPFVHIFDSYKGTGVAEVKCAIFPASTSANTPLAELISQCEDLDDEYITEINGEKGLTLVYELVDPQTGAVTGNGASFRVVAVITNEVGQTVTSDKTVKTAEGTVHPDLEKWAGKWTVSTTESVDITEITEGEYKGYLDLQKGTTAITKTIEITPLPEYSWNALQILGLSSTDAVLYEEGGSSPALATLGSFNNLELNAGVQATTVKYADGSEIPAVWISICDIEGMGLYDMYFGGAVYTIEMNAETGIATTKERYAGYATHNQTGERIPFTVFALELLGYSQQGSTYFIDKEDLPLSYAAGDMTLTRVIDDATPETASIEMSATKNLESKFFSVNGGFRM